ncbi:MAG: RDD family protein [Acidobacteria bacterium]|nr:RDD family protein [Acidobacteriota bacterium]
MTSTAPALQAVYPVETVSPQKKVGPLRMPEVRQPSLFGADPQRAPRVIKFEEIAPPGHLFPPPGKRPADRHSKPSHQDLDELQQRLDFQTVAAQTHGRTHSDSGMYCNNEVASPLHRCCAAVADYSLAAVGLAIFFAIFYLAGGEIVLNRITTPLYCAVPLIIIFLYRVLYCFSRGDTSGIQWLGLRVVDFDGKPPTRRQRWNRCLAGGLSLASGGLGLVWALTDEERLA